jgi:hypothetical protein
MSVIEVRKPAEVKVVTRRDVLLRAADLLEEFGWCQGEFGSKEDGSFCLYGAVDTAHSDLTGKPGWAPREFGIFLHKRLGGCASWNDDPGRTKAEVVARLREAAEAS